MYIHGHSQRNTYMEIKEIHIQKKQNKKKRTKNRNIFITLKGYNFCTILHSYIWNAITITIILIRKITPGVMISMNTDKKNVDHDYINNKYMKNKYNLSSP